MRGLYAVRLRVLNATGSGLRDVNKSISIILGQDSWLYYILVPTAQLTCNMTCIQIQIQMDRCAIYNVCMLWKK